MHSLSFTLSPDDYAIVRLPPQTPVPPQVLSLPFYTVSKTSSELSILLPTAHASGLAQQHDAKIEQSYRAFKVDGTLDFSLVGILQTITRLLGEAGISVFVVSTFDTDYVLVKHVDERVEKARQILQKRVPKNPKYANASATVDSGQSLTKHLRRLSERQKNYKYLENELFRRIKPQTFARLLYESHYVHDLEALEACTVEREAFSSARPGASTVPTPSAFAYDPPAIASRRQPHPSRLDSRVSGLLVDPGHGQELHVDPARSTEAMSEYNYNMPYLLLDVREPDAWRACHIIGALNFPSVFIKRDKVTREQIMYKNKEDKFIIVYDDDESIAGPAAQTLVQRGFDNVYLLAGGLRLLTQKIRGMTVGRYIPPPETVQPAAKTATATKKVLSSRNPLPPIAGRTARSPPPVPLEDLDVFDMDALRLSLESASPTSSIASSRASSRMSLASLSPSSTARPSAIGRSALDISNSPRSLYGSSSRTSNAYTAKSRSTGDISQQPQQRR
ncbi:Centrosomal protein of 41 kDa [Sorochytrium milnesiophthora]